MGSAKWLVNIVVQSVVMIASYSENKYFNVTKQKLKPQNADSNFKAVVPDFYEFLMRLHKKCQ